MRGGSINRLECYYIYHSLISSTSRLPRSVDLLTNFVCHIIPSILTARVSISSEAPCRFKLGLHVQLPSFKAQRAIAPPTKSKNDPTFLNPSPWLENSHTANRTFQHTLRAQSDRTTRLHDRGWIPVLYVRIRFASHSSTRSYLPTLKQKRSTRSRSCYQANTPSRQSTSPMSYKGSETFRTSSKAYVFIHTMH